MSFQADQPADVEVIDLPDARIVTHDGVPIERGVVIYYRFSPGPRATAYRVISDQAVISGSEVSIFAVGPSGRVGPRTPIDHTTCLAAWGEFYQKRHKGQLPPKQLPLNQGTQRQRNHHGEEARTG